MRASLFFLLAALVTPAQPARAADAEAAPEGAPHSHASTGHGAEGLFQIPEDMSAGEPSLPKGTLSVEIRDPSGAPLASIPVTLGILHNSVAKGESRKRVTSTTNDKGIARLDDLETGSAVAYRPMVLSEGATFSLMPFRMPENNGMRAVLHVYPVVHDLDSALIVSQSMIYAEVKDDRIQVQQAFRIYNFGKNAWVPHDFVIPLPEKFTAFTSQEGMTDVGVEAVPKKGVRLRGTFGPGQQMLEFRWQLPYAGESVVSFDVGMAPHMAAARVIAPASRDMKLDISGFPPPQSTNDGHGQRVLVTEKQVRREDPSLTKVSVVIKGLPSEGPGKLLATVLSGAGILAGLVLGSKAPSRRNRGAERERLLGELELLERAHATGTLGPKTYEKARRELLDDVARTFAAEETLPVRAPRARAT